MEQNVDVKAVVLEFVKRNFLMGTSSIKFSDSDSFLEKGIVDSTGVLEMVSFIQTNFGISVEDTELIPENLDSVSNITAYVKRKKNIGS